jgi:hypothetical protein
VGMHRRISRAPSNPSAANIGVRFTSARLLHFARRMARGKPPSRPRDFIRSDAPSVACCACAGRSLIGGTKICAAHRRPEVDRPADPSPRAVIGGQGSSPSPGPLASRASRSDSTGRGAQFFTGRHRHSSRTNRPHGGQRFGHTGQVFLCNPGVECVSRQAAHRSHHPAMAAIARSRSALATSNRSDMAAQS